MRVNVSVHVSVGYDDGQMAKVNCVAVSVHVFVNVDMNVNDTVIVIASVKLLQLSM